MYISVNNVKVKVCKSYKDKLIGLMFKKNIDYGIVLYNCNSVHTFFMKSNIDIYMTDINYKVLYVFKDVKPWKVIGFKKGVYYTFEFKTDVVDYKVGDVIKNA